MHIAILKWQTVILPPRTFSIKETSNVEVLYKNLFLYLFLIDRQINSEQKRAASERKVIEDWANEIQGGIS
jgi:hypothetical protein